MRRVSPRGETENAGVNSGRRAGILYGLQKNLR